MRRIIVESEDPGATIPFDEVNEYTPIFAKKDGKLMGMVVKEDAGWILRIGGKSGATGHHDTAWKCLKSCLIHDYEFFVA